MTRSALTWSALTWSAQLRGRAPGRAVLTRSPQLQQCSVLEPWLLSHAGARSAGPARRGKATLLAAGRLLRTGVTAVVDMAGCGGTRRGSA
jgi:hypothetical protein